MGNQRKPWLILLVTAGLAVCLKHDFIRFLLGFELVLYLAALLEIRYLSARVDGRLEVVQRIVKKGGSFALEVLVSNKSRLPVPELLVRVAIRAFPDVEEYLLTGKVMLDKGETGRVHFELDSAYCGCVEARLERISVWDHLGIFWKRCQLEEDSQKLVFVFPKDEEADGEEAGDRRQSDGDTELDLAAKHWGDEFQGIRSYQQGDLFKLVHWKLSARMRTLMVREFSETGEALFWLYLNLEEEKEPDKKEQTKKKKLPRNREQWDMFFACVETLMQGFLRRKQPVMVVWADVSHRTIVQHRVTDYKSHQEMMCELLHTDSFSYGSGYEILKELQLHDEMEDKIIELDLQGNLTSRRTNEQRDRA